MRVQGSRQRALGLTGPRPRACGLSGLPFPQLLTQEEQRPKTSLWNLAKGTDASLCCPEVPAA